MHAYIHNYRCIYTYVPHHPLFNSAAISSSIVHRYQLHYQFFTTRRRRLCANTTGEIEPNNSRWCIFTHLSIISVGNDLSNAPTDLPIKRVGIPTHRWDSRKFVGWNGSVFVVGRAPNRTETGQTWVATGKKKIPAFVCWFPNLILSSSVSLYSIQRWF